jgi:hypothetical protein
MALRKLKTVVQAAANARTRRLSELVAKLRPLKARIEQLETQYFELEAEALGILAKMGDDPIVIDDLNVTPVRPTRMYYDEAAIRALLGEDLWEQVRRESMDTDKLKGLIQLGHVKAKDIAQYADERPTKPYIKITPVKGAAGKAHHREAI